VIEWQGAAIWAATATAWIVIGTGLLQTGFYIVQLCFAGLSLAQRPPVGRSTLLWRRYAEHAPAIAVLAPAFNEEVPSSRASDRCWRCTIPTSRLW
jgi:hypothetical protein